MVRLVVEVVMAGAGLGTLSAIFWVSRLVWVMAREIERLISAEIMVVLYQKLGVVEIGNWSIRAFCIKT